MENHIKKLVKENAKLVVKIKKLNLFMESKMYDILVWEEQHRMKRQLGAMTSYSSILCERIKAYSDPIFDDEEIDSEH